MPFKSKAQRRWFGKQVEEGKFTKEQQAEWESETPKTLPERAKWPSMQVGPKVRVIRANKVPKK